MKLIKYSNFSQKLLASIWSNAQWAVFLLLTTLHMSHCDMKNLVVQRATTITIVLKSLPNNSCGGCLVRSSPVN